MKKTLLILMMVALIWPFVALPVKAEDGTETTTISSQEEKIPNPAEIKNFTRIRKVGNSLFGFRLSKIIVSTLEEKIPSPAEIKNFTRIRKVGNSLFGYRIMSNYASSTEISTEAVACVQTALEKKDNAIIAAYELYASEVKTAMEARKNAYVAALAITAKLERAKAMVNAFTTYKKAKNEAKDKHKESVKKALSDYKTEIKSCKVEMGQDLDTSESDTEL